jgi:hypothetical protein
MIGVEQKNLTLATNFSKISSVLSAWSNGDLKSSVSLVLSTSL